MFPSVEIIFANLGRIGELREVGNGNHVLNLSVVENFRKKVGEDWVDDEPVWRDIVVWGHEAENFANSDIKPGTPLIIVGTRRTRVMEAYTTEDGREIPERRVDSIQAKHIGVEIGRFNVITGTGKADGSAMSSGSTSKPAAKKAPAKKAPAKEKAAEAADSIFGTDAGDATDSIFGSDF